MKTDIKHRYLDDQNYDRATLLLVIQWEIGGWSLSLFRCRFGPRI